MDQGAGNKTFVVTMKVRSAGVFSIVAARAEIFDQHLVLLSASGNVAGLFLLEDVESWIELPGAQQ